MTRGRLVTIVVLSGAVLYGLFGGEYGTFDWLQLRREARDEQAAIVRLTAEVDSLKRYAHRVETDRAFQEQLAREKFGMIRKGEYLYRIETDSLDSP